MIRFLKKVSYTYMFDTPWIGNVADKLYLQSGQFTSTIKDSESIGGVDINPTGITWDSTNTPWSGSTGMKLYLQSGQFTSTLKTSEDISGIEANPQDVSWDGTNTPWVGSTDDKLYLQSGQFTSTLKTSEDVNGIDAAPVGVSWDSENTPWAGVISQKLYLQSGQFTSTIKTSENIGGIDTQPSGVSWNGTDTLWSGITADKLYLTSGQFTSTIKTSEAVGGNPNGVCTNDIDGRIGPGPQIYDRSRSNTVSLVGGVIAMAIYNRSVNNTASFSQSVPQVGSIFNRSITTTITLGQDNIGNRVRFRSTDNTILLCHDNSSQIAVSLVTINHPQLINNIFFNHQLIITKIFGLPAAQICRQNLSRWIYASTGKYFNAIAEANSLHFFVEGTNRETAEHQKYIEFRLDGPSITELSKNYYRLDVEINILWSFNQDDEDFHETERLKGILMDAMQNICIYRFGDGPNDDDSLVGTLQLRQDSKTSTRVNNFGQVRKDVRLMQGIVEGSYSMYHTC